MKYSLSKQIAIWLLSLMLTESWSVRGQNLTLGNYNVVQSTRVGRTLFQYDLTVVVTNQGSNAFGVTAQVSSTSTNTQVIQNSVGFGDVPYGTSVISSNTFIILQNRLTPFDPSVLQWSIGVQSYGGLPGAIASLEFSRIISPRFVDDPFPVTITARDYQGAVATNFNSHVNLSAFLSTVTANKAMIDMLSENSSFTGSYTAGFAFTPTNDMIVTAVRSISGAKVSVWIDPSHRVISQTVSGVEGAWTTTPLSTEVTLKAGTQYRISSFQPAGNIYYSGYSTDPGFQGVFADGTVDFGCLNLQVLGVVYTPDQEQFPYVEDPGVTYLVDLEYHTGGLVSISNSPGVTGDFSRGFWSGQVTLGATGEAVFLNADDSNGHATNSEVFACRHQDDLSLTLTGNPSPIRVGNQILYSLSISNTGPDVIHSVILSNVLSENQFLASITPQLTGVTNAFDNTISFNLGDLAGGALLQILIAVGTTAPGVASARFSVGGKETDPNPVNNSTNLNTMVLIPTVSLNDVSVFKGFSGSTNAIFTVSVSYPSSNMITGYVISESDYFDGTNYFTAVQPYDYDYFLDPFSISPGQTNILISVPVFGSPTPKYDQTFGLYLDAVQGADVAKGVGVGTIRNDSILPADYKLISESFYPRNGKVDVGESVTLQFTLRNPGPNPVSNLMATLVASTNIVDPSASQSFGFVSAFSTSDPETFSFTAKGRCGSIIIANLQLQDGNNVLGMASFEIPLGSGLSPITQYFDLVPGAGKLPEGWSSTNAAYSENFPSWMVVSSAVDTPPGAVFCQDFYVYADDHLYSPIVTVQSQQATLSFRHKYDIDTFGYALAFLEVSTNGSDFRNVTDDGAVFLKGGYNGFKTWAGSSGDFITSTLLLPPSYAGRQLQFRWRLFVNDYSITAHLISQWYVDSITFLDEDCAIPASPSIPGKLQSPMTMFISRPDSGHVSLEVVSPPLGDCVLESSADGSHWSPVCTNRVVGGQNSFFTLDATNSSLFLRAHSNP